MGPIILKRGWPHDHDLVNLPSFNLCARGVKYPKHVAHGGRGDADEAMRDGDVF